MPATVGIIRTGTANLASVEAALARLGLATRLVDAPATIGSVDALVLPGVGAFGAAMDGMRRHELPAAVRGYVAAGRPFLAICLGLQLLGTGSEETPGVAGLGIIPGRIRRFAGDVRVPQLGWNRVTATNAAAPVEDGWAWYANSYALDTVPEGWNAAWSEHGTPFVAALARPRQLACQFHPELSGAWGADLLGRWRRQW